MISVKNECPLCRQKNTLDTIKIASKEIEKNELELLISTLKKTEIIITDYKINYPKVVNIKEQIKFIPTKIYFLIACEKQLMSQYLDYYHNLNKDVVIEFIQFQKLDLAI
jgi:hypothetical protein